MPSERIIHVVRRRLWSARRFLNLWHACAVAVFLSPAAFAATTLEVVLPAKTTTDVPFTFTVTARNGSAVDGTYAGTVHFTSSDPGPALPADYAFTPGDAGSHQFTATMSRPGPQNEQSGTRTITATDTVTPSITGTGSTVLWWNDNATRHLHIVDPGPVSMGVPFQTEVWALNAYFMDAPGYTGTVHFFGTNGLAVPANYTFTPADNGRHTFTFTPSNGGDVFLSVTDTADTWVFGSRELTVSCPEMTITASNGGPVCPDEYTSSLHATSNQTGVTFTWTRLGSVFWWLNGADQTSIGAGTYVVTVQNGSGCSLSAQTVVTTNFVVTPRIAVPERTCGTVHVSLSDSSLFTNIVWRVVNGTVIHGQGTASADVDPAPEATTGGLWIRLTADMPGSGCHVESISHEVMIDSTAAAALSVSAPASTCAGASNTASVEGSATNTYSWSISNGSIVSGQGTRNIEYVANGPGVTVLSVSMTDGSCAENGVAMTTVSSSPTITSPPESTLISVGQRATLSVGAAGTDLLFDWYRGVSPDRSQLVASGPDSQFTTPPLTTTTSYWVEARNACGADRSATALVIVNGRRRAASH
jgi:hypothetical protein